MLKEAAYGLGCDDAARWSGKVVLPYSRVGVIGGSHAGAGPRARRDHGGHLRHRQLASESRASLLAPGTTISSSIANEFTEAVETIHTSALVALGLILFVITLIVLAAARLMLHAHEQASGSLSMQPARLADVAARRRKSANALFQGLC